jgi:hypothetical protein
MTFTKVNKEANTKIAMKSLQQKGWSSMQAAAIIGNLTAESYMNPRTPRGDEGSAMGLAQWRGDRLKKFTEVIGKHCEVASLEEQLRFVNWELRNTEKKAGNLLKTAPNLVEAVKVIDKYYERSAGIHLDRRIKFATEALKNYGQPVYTMLDERLDTEVEDSMDASDPPSVTTPGTNTEPVPSSTEPKPAQKSFWQKILEAILALFGRK